MEYPKIRHRDGHFSDPALEQSYLEDNWSDIRLQTAVTLMGLSVTWLLTISMDFYLLAGTPYFIPSMSAQIFTGSFGVIFGLWLLFNQPDHNDRYANLGIYLWLASSVMTAMVVAVAFPATAESANFRTDVVVFSSFWMSMQVMALGIALAHFSWGIAGMAMAYSLVYLGLIIHWNDQLEFMLLGQFIMLASACVFGWIMAVVFSQRARRRFHVTRLYEEAKIAAEKSQEFSSFLLAATGHDIRQPVYAIDMNAELMEDLASKQQWDEVTSAIQRQRVMTRNVARMLSSLLELSYLDSSKRELVKRILLSIRYWKMLS